jgi:hypothetical protein
MAGLCQTAAAAAASRRYPNLYPYLDAALAAAAPSLLVTLQDTAAAVLAAHSQMPLHCLQSPDLK